MKPKFNTSKELIDEYNHRMHSDEYPNKDEVRNWYAFESQLMMNTGKHLSFEFLYPDMICTESLKKLLNR